jgi:FG-GAP-like repeat
MRASYGFLLCLSWMLASVVAVAQSNPVPFVDQPLAPMSAPPGASGFMMTVNGTGFVSGSIVSWNGTPLPTTFVSKARLTAIVAAADIASAQTASVTVSNPAPGGGISNVAFFQVAVPESTVALSTPINTGAAGVAVVSADFNGDGKLDLAVTGTNAQDNPVVSILLGKGDGTFQSPVVYPISFSPVATAPMATGDFNGDGKLDLVAGHSVLLGNGDGTFQPASSLPAQYVPSSSDLFVAGDFNGDGELDLVALEQSVGDLLVMLGNGNGTFTTLTPIAVTEDCDAADAAGCTIYNALSAADFNGDGVLDLVVAYTPSPREGQLEGSGTLAVYLGNGDGTFQTPVLTSASSSPTNYVNLYQIAAADFNGDGEQDVFSGVSHPMVSSPIVEEAGVSLGEGNGAFTFNANGFTLAEYLPFEPAFTGDFNADGKLDVATDSNIALGNGDGTFQTPPIALSNVNIAAVGDFNGDGRLDFAVIKNQGLNLLVELQASPDFSLAVSSQKTVTVSPGQAANYALTLSPVSGFSQTVQLSCTGGPPQSTCTVTPSSVTLTGTGIATAKVEVVTAAGSANLLHPSGFRPIGNRLALWLALPGLSGLVLIGNQGGRAGKRHLRLFHGFIFCCFLFVAITWIGCGGSGNSATPPGTYSLSVTGTFTSGSNMLKHAVSLTLIVQ